MPKKAENNNEYKKFAKKANMELGQVLNTVGKIQAGQKFIIRDIGEIKKKIKTLPCKEHHDALLKIKTEKQVMSGVKRHVWKILYLVLGGIITFIGTLIF